MERTNEGLNLDESDPIRGSTNTIYGELDMSKFILNVTIESDGDTREEGLRKAHASFKTLAEQIIAMDAVACVEKEDGAERVLPGGSIRFSDKSKALAKSLKGGGAGKDGVTKATHAKALKRIKELEASLKDATIPKDAFVPNPSMETATGGDTITEGESTSVEPTSEKDAGITPAATPEKDTPGGVAGNPALDALTGSQG